MGDLKGGGGEIVVICGFTTVTDSTNAETSIQVGGVPIKIAHYCRLPDVGIQVAETKFRIYSEEYRYRYGTGHNPRFSKVWQLR